jgi:two-component system, NarL family, sensor kinase
MLTNRMPRRTPHAYALARMAAGEVDELTALRGEVERLTQELECERERERRRIAREMHDSTVQDLVAIGLMLRRLQDMVDETEARKVLGAAREILGRTQQDLRTLSYLMHPPMLDDQGLVVALQTLIRGLASRMRIRVTLVCETPGLRTSPEVETALYRVVQESLINIHKHAAASCAVVHYGREPGRLVLEIEDDGVGMRDDAELLMGAGVGIQAMGARLQQVGGTLDLSSPGGGLLVRAEVPVLEADWGFEAAEQFLLPIIEWKEGLP